VPPSLLRDLATLPVDQGAVLLIRHGEREDLPPGLPGDHVPLTALGHAQSIALGNTLKGRLGNVRASPVLRCRQTARAILGGAAREQAHEPSSLLGAPGPFVIDSATAWPLFVQHGVHGLTTLQLRRIPLPGLRPTDEGCTLLLDSLRARPAAAGQIDVCVTHDLILALLAGFLLGERDAAALWPDFLEGILLWFDGPALRGFYRGRALEHRPQTFAA
jgi:hypothetical protein